MSAVPAVVDSEEASTAAIAGGIGMVALNKPTRPLFPLGRTVATPAALDVLLHSRQSPVEFLSRHVRGDWGNVGREDWTLNDKAVVEGTRILSAYVTARNDRLWVITEADRSSTCLLLPEEY